MKKQLQQVGRLAFRAEGRMWNCYYAREDTMQGATLLGSILLSAAAVPAVKQQFIGVMRAALNEAFANVLGTVPTWQEPTPAPEHERSGNG